DRSRQQVQRLGELLFELPEARRPAVHEPCKRQHHPDRCRNDRREWKTHEPGGDDGGQHARAQAHDQHCARRGSDAGLLDQPRQAEASSRPVHEVVELRKRSLRAVHDEGGVRGVWTLPHLTQAARKLASLQRRERPHGAEIDAHHQPGHAKEHQHGGKHYFTSMMPSNMVPGSVMPDARSRSQTLGLTPVARKRPVTLPSCVMPAFSNAKISCMVITSPSMPVISETLVTLRVPSLRRVCWTMI